VLTAVLAELLQLDLLLGRLLVLVGDVHRTAFLAIGARELDRFAHGGPLCYHGRQRGITVCFRQLESLASSRGE